MLCFSRPSVRTRELDKNIDTADILIYIVVAWVVRYQSYETMGQDIKRLVASVRMFCMRLLLNKYWCYPTVRHFAPVIQRDCNIPCGLAYKVFKEQL